MGWFWTLTYCQSFRIQSRFPCCTWWSHLGNAFILCWVSLSLECTSQLGSVFSWWDDDRSVVAEDCCCVLPAQCLDQELPALQSPQCWSCLNHWSRGFLFLSLLCGGDDLGQHYVFCFLFLSWFSVWHPYCLRAFSVVFFILLLLLTNNSFCHKWIKILKELIQSAKQEYCLLSFLALSEYLYSVQLGVLG